MLNEKTLKDKLREVCEYRTNYKADSDSGKDKSIMYFLEKVDDIVFNDLLDILIYEDFENVVNYIYYIFTIIQGEYDECTYWCDSDFNEDQYNWVWIYNHTDALQELFEDVLECYHAIY